MDLSIHPSEDSDVLNQGGGGEPTGGDMDLSAHIQNDDESTGTFKYVMHSIIPA
jgi:hypothetical protein